MMGYPIISAGIEMGSLLANKLMGGFALERTASRGVRRADVDGVIRPNLVSMHSIALLDTADGRRWQSSSVALCSRRDNRMNVLGAFQKIFSQSVVLDDSGLARSE